MRGKARPPCSASPRVRGEVDLAAEPLRSEADRVRGLVHKLRLAATPPRPDSFAALGIRPLPARGERWRKWFCLALQDPNSYATALRVRGEVDLRAEPLRSEANRVRGLVRKLRLAATPPHPDSFAALGIRPLPARGERWSKRRARCRLQAASHRRCPPLKGEGGARLRPPGGAPSAHAIAWNGISVPTVEQHSYRPRDPARRHNNRRKLMREILAAGLIAAGAWCVGASPSVAAPANGVALGDAAGELGIAESVHCRRYVHWPSWGRGTGGGRRGAVVIHEGVRVRRPGVRVRVHTGDRVRSSTSIRSRESTTVRSREGATVRGGREGGGATIRSGQDGGGRTGQGGAAQRERSGGGGQTGTSGAGGGGGGGGSSTGSTGQGGASGGGASGAGGAGGGSR